MVTAARGRREELIPSAARLLVSLRDLGYEFVNAVADLVDNSISAGATAVEVTIQPEGVDSWVRIADNGGGMSAAQISEAMRLGSGGRDYAADELGKFGLGLKTASLSQARSVTVASRSNPTRRILDVRELDLDEVVRTDRWEIIHPAAEDRSEAAVTPLQDHTGTVVLWRRLDRILNLTDPFGGYAESRLGRYAERLDQHLGMVFGRFLSGQADRCRTTPLTISINGNPVEAWDPFCLDEQTHHLPEHHLQVGDGHVRYRPYVLPSQREFSSDEAWKRASGPNQWNRQQGLYIYRADRLIQSGGWSWLRGTEEHVKLARAALEFWPALDEKFEINISKMRVKIPEELRDQLKGLVSLLSGHAQVRYRQAAKATRPPAPPPPAAKRPAVAGSGGTSPAAGPGATPRAPAVTANPAAPVPAGGGGDTPAGEVTGIGAGDGIAPVEFAPVSPPQAVGPAARRLALQQAARDAGVESALDTIRQQLLSTDPGAAHDLGW